MTNTTSDKNAKDFGQGQIEAWIVDARDGSDRAVGDLLAACKRYLLLIADQSLDPDLRPKISASDVVQETLLEAFRDFATFRGRTDQELRGWLRQILLHNLANEKRHCLAAKRDVARELPLGAVEDPAAPDRTPSSAAATNEATAFLEEAMHKLSAEHQHVLRLRCLERLPFEEVGRHMQRSAEAARKLWFRAVKRLQAEFNDHG